MITRSNQKHKPGKRIKVKERAYLELVASLKELEERTERYGEIIQDLTRGLEDDSSIRERAPELWQEAPTPS